MENEDAKKWLTKGWEFYCLNNAEEAIKCYAKAARLDPTNALIFNHWGDALLVLAETQQSESLYQEAIKKYVKVERLGAKIVPIFRNDVYALWGLAALKKDESLYRKSFKKFDELARLLPTNALVFYNWGTALLALAAFKPDESLYHESIEKYTTAARLDPNGIRIFNNWGYMLSRLAKTKNKDEKRFLKELEDFEKASEKIEHSHIYLTKGRLYYCLNQENKAKEYFIKSEKDILAMFTYLDEEDKETAAITNIFCQLLDSDVTNDGHFFQTATKDVNKEGLDRYKEAYIQSILIISRLYVNNRNEKVVAHYLEKTVLQKMLFQNTSFRLNAINYSNDPAEGKVLLECLPTKKSSTTEVLNAEYGVFAGCFIFNYDSLNQFRLYGKDGDGVEGTGVSLAFSDSFFSEEAKMATTLLKTKSKNPQNIEDNDTNMSSPIEPEESEEKYALFRCMYIDPETQRVEAVGHKEEYLFYREDKKNAYRKFQKYSAYLATVISGVKKNMKKLKTLVRGLDSSIVEQLLINLRYLTKHVAFKEEQECRIVKIHQLRNNKKIKRSEDAKQMYVEYEPKVSKHIEKIIFGPKATGMELFQDMLTHENINIRCEQSKNPLA